MRVRGVAAGACYARLPSTGACCTRRGRASRAPCPSAPAPKAEAQRLSGTEARRRGGRWCGGRWCGGRWCGGWWWGYAAHVVGSDVEARRRRARRLLRTGCRHARHLQELHRRRATEERELASHGAARRAARPHYTAERCEMMASLGAVAVDDELHLVAVPREVDEDERHSVLPPCCQASLHDGGGGRALTGCQTAVGCDEHRDGCIVGGRT